MSSISETFLCIKSIKNFNYVSERKTLKSSELSKSFVISELLYSSLMDEIQIKP